jgi:Rrf2 family protein
MAGRVVGREWNAGATLSISSRFVVAVHVLTLLAASGGDPVTSERIASSVNTNPAVIRRLLCALSRAGLTRSRRGTGGGALLARPASEIRLLDVYRAVDPGALFALHPERPNAACPIGRHIENALDEATASAQRALEDALAGRTVGDVMARVKADAGPTPSGIG